MQNFAISFFSQKTVTFYEFIEFGAEKSLVGNAYGKWVWTDLEEWA